MAGWDDLSDLRIRQMASAYGINPEGQSREDLIEVLEDEGLTAAESLESGPAPDLPPLSQGSDIRRRAGSLPDDEFPDLDAQTALGVAPRNAMPENPGASYPDRGSDEPAAEPEPEPTVPEPSPAPGAEPADSNLRQ